MAKDQTETKKTVYVPVLTRVTHSSAKMKWLMAMLESFGIAYKLLVTVAGLAFTVDRDEAGTVLELLHMSTGTINPEGASLNDAHVVPFEVLISDLPDDHEFFVYQIAGYKSAAMKPVPETLPPPTGLVLVPNPEFQDLVQQVKEEQAEENFLADSDDVPEEFSGWNFDSDDDTIEKESEADAVEAMDEIVSVPGEAPVIEVAATVTNADDDDADPDFDAAVAQPAPKASDLDSPILWERADELLKYEDTTLLDFKKPIRMYHIESSTIDQMGGKVLLSKPDVATLVVRFKSGGLYYRYSPVLTDDFHDLLRTAIRRAGGIQEASTGSEFHHMIKVKAEEGLIRCQRLSADGTSWSEVLPKAQRVQQTKDKAKG